MIHKKCREGTLGKPPATKAKAATGRKRQQRNSAAVLPGLRWTDSGERWLMTNGPRR